MTLAESMAIAVLKGDLLAAYALVDLLLEQRANPRSMLEQAAETHSLRLPTADSYVVFAWPEFRALCDRLGVAIDLRTRSLTIRLAMDKPVVVEQDYLGTDLSQ